MDTPKYTSKDIERFWQKVRITTNPDDCWEWQAYCAPNGYGHFQMPKAKLSSHRVAYEIVNGEIKDGLLVLHTCDNRKCVNPYHLFLGTQQDNIDDMMRKGRKNPIRGEQIGNHKLTWEIVERIRELHSTGQYKQKDIAAMMNISKQQVSRIIRRDIWEHR